ncbi:ABC transporter permease [Salinibacterium sp. NG253]|uniref:ABC transporter permease n=1 Tax=Salinibacterium sp. NG253 TaxID=2792039 RepID=UPI0018CEE584|nr:ABC transporter permease [Salinibacterium sp. NG253]MBH0116688.1 ABC transporter permease [Salinibacterium sp. NG253]
MSRPTPTMALKVMRSTGHRRVTVSWTISIVVLGLFTLAAIFAPLVAPYNPDQLDFGAIYANPNLAHWLGTDSLGRDTLSRIIYGARTALLAPLIVVIASTILGILLGLLAGWRGGWIDAAIGRLLDVLLSFPALLIAILAVALFGKGLVAPVIAMSIAYAPFVARLTRSLVISERARPYVSAYRVQGFSGGWIALRRVLPNVVPTVGAQSTLNFGYVLAELAGLSFLGLGVQAPTADWGAMINESQAGLVGGHFLPALIPAIAVVIVVVAVNVIGEEISERIGGGTPA